MSDDRLELINRIFEDTLQLPPEEQDPFLHQACAGDAELETRIKSLLSHHSKDTGFMEKPIWQSILKPGEDERINGEDLSPEPDLPFENLGEYRLIRLLGGGGMGEVYLALQQPMNRKVALKIIRADRKSHFEVETRFWREIEAVSKLSHPNIVTVYGSGQDQDVRYFAMELLQGSDLDEIVREVLARKERFPLLQAVRWIRDLASALDYVHKKGIIHRDIKPSNIRITPDGQAKLMDFGVARLVRLSTLTLTGEFRGTLQYASPEQVQGKIQEIDPKTDIYSLGSTLYELVTGRLPFDGETDEQVSRRIQEEDPIAPRRLNQSIPGDLETIILKAMEKEPQHRYETMAEFGDDLDRFLNDVPILAKPPSPLYQLRKFTRRHRTLVTSTALLFSALTLGLLTTLFFFFDAKAKENRALLAEENYRYERNRAYSLSGLRKLEELKQEAESLWPRRPEMIGKLKFWMQRSGELCGSLASYHDFLSELRLEGSQDSKDDWKFSDYDLQWLHDNLNQLINDLSDFSKINPGSVSDIRFTDPDISVVADVTRRLELAETIEEKTVTEYAKDWNRAKEQIRSSEVYSGLQLESQVGLIPLAPDPESGLWEFWLYESGDRPVRESNNKGWSITKDTGLVLVLLPGGKYYMGVQKIDPEQRNYDPNADQSEEPPHEITLDPFFMSKYEMTQAQWIRIMGSNPSAYQNGSDCSVKIDPKCRPVEGVNWSDCQLTLERLALELPTEAQWEYGTRGGTSTIWWTGNDPKSIEGAANIADKARYRVGKPLNLVEAWLEDYFGNHAPVGSYRANPFGLHDTIGNVSEWCRDGYANYPDINHPPRIGDGFRHIPETQFHLTRGGSFDNYAIDVRSSIRRPAEKEYSSWTLGVRPVMCLTN